ncbi:F420-dependent oxidoreductase [archaeon]|nr:MAG: F420-dependent oxidoreductase [archaeon]
MICIGEKYRVIGLSMPEIELGSDLAEMIVKAANEQAGGIQNGDVIVVTSKIISKAKGYLEHYLDIKPSKKAKIISRLTGKPDWKVELILKHSKRIIAAIPLTRLLLEMGYHKMMKNPKNALEVLRRDPVMLVVENRQGMLCTDAGLDTSNTPYGVASIPPPDPDEEARLLRERIEKLVNKRVAVVVTDTEATITRLGSVDIAVGSSGIRAIKREFGQLDLYGKPKYGGVDIVVNEIAAAAALLMGQTHEGVPVVIVRGLEFERDCKEGVKDIVITHEMLMKGARATFLLTLKLKLRLLLYKLFRL